MRQPRVTLVSLPWTMLTEPNLGLGILSALLERAGIPCRVRHLNLFTLRFLRPATYQAIANVFALNDFMFSGVLEPEISDRQRRWLRIKTLELLSMDGIDRDRHGGVDGVTDELLRLRQETIPAWLGGFADEIAASDATLVGMSCMFDQTFASVALGKLIKERAPDKFLVLGGYAVRPPTDSTLLSAFPWIDAVCVDEGEPAILPLAYASVERTRLHEVPGLSFRTSGGVCTTSIAPPFDLNASPVPSYGDFYADVAELARDDDVHIKVTRLPLENSRGCWWGAKKHCVFCGIRDDDLVFRARDASRVLEALDVLHERHGVDAFRFSDYILPHKYFSTLLPMLVRRGAPYRITSEMKANITPERFALLAAAGFEEVQPGVESFSTRVLREMDKGVSAARNVQTLLLGRRHGVRVDYNLLYGLPGDDTADYEVMLRALPRLRHLDPPCTRLRVQITRFAPLQVDPERFGIPAAAYEPSYDLVLSAEYVQKTGFRLQDYCYYFERPFQNDHRLEAVYRRIDALVDEWRCGQHDGSPMLTYEEVDGGMLIRDSRCAPERGVLLSPETAAVLLKCEQVTTFSALYRDLPADRHVVDDALRQLEELELIFVDGDHVIGLALPAEMTGSEAPFADSAVGAVASPAGA